LEGIDSWQVLNDFANNMKHLTTPPPSTLMHA